MSIWKISDYRVAREKSIKNSYIPKINDTDFITKSSVTLLGVKTDKNLILITIYQPYAKKREKGEKRESKSCQHLYIFKFYLRSACLALNIQEKF